MRDTTKLHPQLQVIIPKLIAACAAQGIGIKIGECLRTVSEQDALYAKGRTVSGSIVTNAKGSSYSSMHQWGVAFDFYLNMDVDKDGKTSDDAYNNNTGLFNKVGKIGQSLGLEWGGSWTSIHDLPHFQLPQWGSTAKKLRAAYGTPEKFFQSWKKTSGSVSNNASTQEHYVVDYKKALAKSVGLPENAAAADVLAKTVTLHKGCKGLGVAAIQYYCYCWGYYTGAIDGEWGKQTDACVYQLQKDKMGYANPDKVFTAKGKCYKKMLDLV